LRLRRIIIIMDLREAYTQAYNYCQDNVHNLPDGWHPKETSEKLVETMPSPETADKHDMLFLGNEIRAGYLKWAFKATIGGFFTALDKNHIELSDETLGVVRGRPYWRYSMACFLESK